MPLAAGELPSQNRRETGVNFSRLAPAKVNLFLHVTGRREDGYHQIQSVFAFASFGDRLQVEPSEELELHIGGTFAPALEGKGNLVLEAAELLAREGGGVLPGARIHLQKNLPVAAGIGSGSSDAAAALLLLKAHWGIDLPGSRMMELALQLGADVPACLLGRPALVEGIGEKVSPLSQMPEMPLLLVNPGVALDTSEVFAAYSRRNAGYSLPLEGANAEGFDCNLEILLGTGNDLQSAAVDIVPEIAVCLDALSRTRGCLLSRMSGSGATCFGLFKTGQQAIEAADRLRAERADWWIEAGFLCGGER